MSYYDSLFTATNILEWGEQCINFYNNDLNTIHIILIQKYLYAIKNNISDPQKLDYFTNSNIKKSTNDNKIINMNKLLYLNTDDKLIVMNDLLYLNNDDFTIIKENINYINRNIVTLVDTLSSFISLTCLTKDCEVIWDILKELSVKYNIQILYLNNIAHLGTVHENDVISIYNTFISIDNNQIVNLTNYIINKAYTGQRKEYINNIIDQLYKSRWKRCIYNIISRNCKPCLKKCIKNAYPSLYLYNTLLINKDLNIIGYVKEVITNGSLVDAIYMSYNKTISNLTSQLELYINKYNEPIEFECGPSTIDYNRLLKITYHNKIDILIHKLNNNYKIYKGNVNFVNNTARNKIIINVLYILLVSCMAILFAFIGSKIYD